MVAAMNRFPTTLLLFLTTLLFGRSLGQRETEDILGVKDEGWYTKYERYPEYCSTPEQMEQRSIPPLTKADQRIGETRLVHATVVIRHGARTPWHGGYQCWDGYWENLSTGVWDCVLTTMMAPPTPEHITRTHHPGSHPHHPGTTEQHDEPTVEPEQGDPRHHAKHKGAIFEKQYDGLEKIVGFPTFQNQLGGTCLTGQLILQGYQQEWTNGQFLRNAYVFDRDSDVHDVRMRLLDKSHEPFPPWQEPKLYFRSDDEQRTLMSGQILIQGMLDPELREWSEVQQELPVIPLHTADYSQDILSANTQVCPRLAEIGQKVEESTSYKDFVNSSVGQEVHDFIQNDLNGDPDNFDIFGCLMETVCTDRDLPNQFEYPTENGMFEKMITFRSELVNRVFMANDGEFAKLAMAPLWTQIMRNVGAAAPLSKIAIFSGHDTTISPLLSSLGIWNATDWPHFASMFVIEMHEFQGDKRDQSTYPSKTGFRLVYNGQIITSLLDKCPDDAEICDMSILLGHVGKFIKGQSCEATTNLQQQQVNNSQSDNGSSQQDLYHSIAMMLVGTVFGVIVAIIFMRTPLLFKKQSQEFDGLRTTDMPEEIEEEEIGFEDRFINDNEAAVIS